MYMYRHRFTNRIDDIDQIMMFLLWVANAQQLVGNWGQLGPPQPHFVQFSSKTKQQ